MLSTEKWLSKFKLKKFPEPEIVRLKHPVLLCHGYGAISSLVKPSPLYDIAMLMRRHHVLAFAPNIVPYAKIETRAAEWVPIIHELCQKTDASKINIVAHSMAGLDIRYALSKLDIAPSVASFTTICTPHHGTSLAELILKTPHAIRDKLADVMDWMGDQLYPDIQSDATGSAQQLTRKYVQETFNPNVADVPGIPYYSFSSAVGKGTSQPIQLISRYQNNYIYEQEGPNDGMISVKSAQWGHHVETGSLSHLEQIQLGVKKERRSILEAFWLKVLNMLEENGH